MRFNDYRPTPPTRKHNAQPWHPQTIEDIRGLDIYTLPKTIPSSVRYSGETGLWVSLGRFAGHPGFVKERMEATFQQFPNVGFSIDDNGVVYSYTFETPLTINEVTK